jgi:ABC-type proline/glycine betaine transport system permease subunit
MQIQGPAQMPPPPPPPAQKAASPHKRLSKQRLHILLLMGATILGYLIWIMLLVTAVALRYSLWRDWMNLMWAVTSFFLVFLIALTMVLVHALKRPQILGVAAYGLLPCVAFLFCVGCITVRDTVSDAVNGVDIEVGSPLGSLQPRTIISC